MDESAEVLDVVGTHDRKIDTMLRGNIKELFQTTGRYIRYADCFLQNPQGHLWVPRRTLHKKFAPGGFDFAASEHVQSGEDYRAAMLRGLQEELRLNVSTDALQEVGKLGPANGRPYFSMIYMLQRTDEPAYDPEDFTGFDWMAPQELLRQLEAGAEAKLELPSALRLLLAR